MNPENEIITDTDKPYHSKIMIDITKATEYNQFIQKAIGARDSWMEYLKDTYQLLEGDSVSVDGKITRANK